MRLYRWHAMDWRRLIIYEGHLHQDLTQFYTLELCLRHLSFLIFHWMLLQFHLVLSPIDVVLKNLMIYILLLGSHSPVILHRLHHKNWLVCIFSYYYQLILCTLVNPILRVPFRLSLLLLLFLLLFNINLLHLFIDCF